MKSLLKLYSSISVERLSVLAQLSSEELLEFLIRIKYRSQQFLRDSENSSVGLIGTAGEGVPEFFHADGVFESVSDIHFFIENNAVSVDEKQKKQKFADFFLQNALRLGQCSSDLRHTRGYRGRSPNSGRTKASKKSSA